MEAHNRIAHLAASAGLRSGLLLFSLMIVAATGRPSTTSLAQPEFPVPSQLPPHSWASVGRMAFAHLAKREGPLNSSDAQFLARFQMVCFEKPTDQAHTGWAEDKMNAAARAVKRARPEVWTLRYINGLLDFTGADTNFSLHYKAAARGLLWPPFHANWSTFDVTDPRMRVPTPLNISVSLCLCVSVSLCLCVSVSLCLAATLTSYSHPIKTRARRSRRCWLVSV